MNQLYECKNPHLKGAPLSLLRWRTAESIAPRFHPASGHRTDGPLCVCVCRSDDVRVDRIRSDDVPEASLGAGPSEFHLLVRQLGCLVSNAAQHLRRQQKHASSAHTSVQASALAAYRRCWPAEQTAASTARCSNCRTGWRHMPMGVVEPFPMHCHCSCNHEIFTTKVLFLKKLY